MQVEYSYLLFARKFQERFTNERICKMKIVNRAGLSQLAGHSLWSIFLLTLVVMIGVSACAPVQAPTQSVSGIIPITGSTATIPAATAMSTGTQTTPTVSQTAGPKAYIGLFKDNAVAVLDTKTNQV